MVGNNKLGFVSTLFIVFLFSIPSGLGVMSANLDIATLNQTYVPYVGSINDTNLGVFSLTASYLYTNYIDFNTSYVDGHSEGRLQWNIDDGTLEFGMPGSNVNQQIGLENLRRVKWGETISNGDVVYACNSTGQRITVCKTDWDSFDTSLPLGIATEDGTLNQFGYINTFGYVRDIDTTGEFNSCSDGDIAWLSNDGGFTCQYPSADKFRTVVGIIVNSHATSGIIDTSIDIVPRLDGLSYVDGNCNNDEILKYNSATQVWGCSVDKDTNTNAGTICADGEYLDGDTNCYNVLSTVENITASTTYLPTSFFTKYGTESGGNNIGNLSYDDDETFNVTEAGGVNALELYINFTGVNKTPDFITMSHQYIGNHYLLLQLWDYDANDWETYDNIEEQGDLIKDSVAILDGSAHVSGGLVQIRFIHPVSGNINHRLILDFVNLVNGFSTITTSEHDGLSGRGDILMNHPNSADVFLKLNQSTSQTVIEGKVVSNEGFDINPVGTPSFPGAPTLAGSPGNINNGTHYYWVSYVTALGETGLRTLGGVTVTDNTIDGQVNVSLPISTDYRVTARKIYRGKANEANYVARYLATVSNNVDTSYIDNIPDSSLGTTNDYWREDTTTRYITIKGSPAMLIGTGLEPSLTLGSRAGEGYFTGLSSGGANTYLGTRVGYRTTTGSKNVGVGYIALQDLTTGGSNQAIGWGAGVRLTSGSFNQAMGRDAIYYNTIGSNNVGIGDASIFGTSGESQSGNTAVGHRTGFNLGEGNNYNVLLGHYAGYNLKDSNKLYIEVSGSTYVDSPLIYGDFAQRYVKFGEDNTEFRLGTNNDFSTYFDGTNQKFDLNTGKFIFNNNIEIVKSTPASLSMDSSGSTSSINFKNSGASKSGLIFNPTSGDTYLYDYVNSGYIFRFDEDLNRFNLGETNSVELRLPNSNQKLSQGASNEYSQYFDGTNQIYNISTGEFHFHNSTGYGIINVHDLVTHTYNATQDNALESFGVEDYKIRNIVTDLSQPVNETKEELVCKTITINKTKEKCIYENIYETIDYEECNYFENGDYYDRNCTISKKSVPKEECSEKEYCDYVENSEGKYEKMCEVIETCIPLENEICTEEPYFEYEDVCSYENVTKTIYPYTKYINGTSQGQLLADVDEALSDLNINIDLENNYTKLKTDVIADAYWTATPKELKSKEDQKIEKNAIKDLIKNGIVSGDLNLRDQEGKLNLSYVPSISLDGKENVPFEVSYKTDALAEKSYEWLIEYIAITEYCEEISKGKFDNYLTCKEALS